VSVLCCVCVCVCVCRARISLRQTRHTQTHATPHTMQFTHKPLVPNKRYTQTKLCVVNDNRPQVHMYEVVRRKETTVGEGVAHVCVHTLSLSTHTHSLARLHTHTHTHTHTTYTHINTQTLRLKVQTNNNHVCIQR
jgi:hypothetical protein